MTGTKFRAGYVALIGLPNVGKSTLLNRLVGQYVSIVAPRPQTTRHRVLGILNGDGFQLLLLDTPGLLKPAYKLQELMEKEIERAFEDADVVLLLLDATNPELEHEVWRNPQLAQLVPVAAVGDLTTSAEPANESGALRGSRPSVVVAFNKVDKADKAGLLALAARLKARGLGNVFMVSALRGDGIEELKQALVAALPEGEPFYPPDMVSERPERFFVAEFIRESIFNRYGAEVPYATTVVVDEFTERPGRKDYIRATIYVERDTQKAIVIGRDGAALRQVGSSARRRIEQFLGRAVYLELWVKVAEAWRRNETFIRRNIYPR
ncbi:MAG: GTPase Era [candidate division WOR-3 bacterium]